MKSLKTFGNLVKRAVPAAVLLLVVIYFGVSITAANRTIAYFKLNNLKDIEEPYSYPDIKMVYARRQGIFVEVGIYPRLNKDIEEEIRDMGRPYSALFVKYRQAEKEEYPEYYFDPFGHGIPGETF